MSKSAFLGTTDGRLSNGELQDPTRLAARAAVEVALLFEMLDHFVIQKHMYALEDISPTAVSTLYESAWRGAGERRAQMLEFYWEALYYDVYGDDGCRGYYNLRLYTRRH